MTLLVEPLRNLPFIQGLPHGSSLWMAGQASPPLGCTGAPLDQTNSPFTATKPHSHGGDSAWWVNPLLKIKHLGLNNPHWNFWEMLELLGGWIQGWQHYLLHQEKTNQDKWNPCETTEAGVHVKVWYTLQSLQLQGFYGYPILYRRWAQTAQYCWDWSRSRHVPDFSEIALKTQVLTERPIENMRWDKKIYTLEPRNSVCLNSLRFLCILCDCGPTWSRACCFKTHKNKRKEASARQRKGREHRGQRKRIRN